jgi:hypothetical protein
MGAVSMREDALERLSMVQWIQPTAPGADARPVVVQRPVVYPCPICPQVYGTESALGAHIFQRHGTEGFYVRLNDAVPAEVVVVPGPVWQLEVIATGHSPAAIDVAIGSDRPQRFEVEPGSPKSLLPMLDEWSDGDSLQIGRADKSGEHAYVIFKGAAPSIDVDKLDDMVAEAQEPLWHGQPGRWQTLRAAERSVEPLAARYLRGFAEYLLAIQFEVFHHDFEPARRGLEAAFGRLRVYNSALARAASALLAFRMESYGLVRRMGPASTLWSAAHYFDSPATVPEPFPDLRIADRGVWIDNYQEGLLRVANDALRGHPKAALEHWQSLPPDLTAAPGNGAKRDIAGARLYAELGDRRRSRALYGRLLDYPGYEAEARAGSA